MNAFLTGSARYGLPTPDSDVDVVILTDTRTFSALALVSDNYEDAVRDSRYDTCVSLRFGKLNLIVMTDPAQYAAWFLGTERCVDDISKTEEGFVTRKRAVELIKDVLDLVPKG